MAFWDFLGKDVAGYSNAVNDPGGLGVHTGTPNSGVTWGDLIQTAVNSNSKPGSSAPMFSNAFMRQQQRNIPINQIPGFEQPQQQKKSTLGDVGKLLTAYFGLGS